MIYAYLATVALVAAWWCPPVVREADSRGDAATRCVVMLAAATVWPVVLYSFAAFAALLDKSDRGSR